MGESLVYRFENCLKIFNLFIYDLGFTAILLSTKTNSTEGVEKGGRTAIGGDVCMVQVRVLDGTGRKHPDPVCAFAEILPLRADGKASAAFDFL